MFGQYQPQFGTQVRGGQREEREAETVWFISAPKLDQTRSMSILWDRWIRMDTPYFCMRAAIKKKQIKMVTVVVVVAVVLVVVVIVVVVVVVDVIVT
jgi:hypothetical protein